MRDGLNLEAGRRRRVFGLTADGMEPSMKSLIEAIHGSPTQAVLNLSGGASQALGWLLSVNGASSTVLEVSIPYCRASMVQLLGMVPQQFVSQDAAKDISLVAYNRAVCLAMPDTPVAGIGFTGALASVPFKRGDHRCHIAARTKTSLRQYNLSLSKGLRDRAGEDNVTSRLLIKVLADVSGISTELSLGLNPIIEKVHEARLEYSEDEQLEQLINGQICMVAYAAQRGETTGRRVVLSGSFNPLHDGHLKLMDIACSLCEGGVPCFELSAINADKPPLSLDEIKRRVKQFEDKEKTVIITNQPYFFKKAELFMNSTFVVGVDTALRLVNPKYYGGSQAQMLQILGGIEKLGCNFLVAGRNVGHTFQVLGDLDIPVEIQPMFKEISQELFRNDISSTELRQLQSLDKRTL